ncbi:MCE family protein [Aeromicrobium sp. CF3.5]|uniref:MCE family protein n=1 Tax=Aeromicrobium sp. CF3.5 TaxID=3373078 RepID=UPI003EE6E1CF
MPRTRLLERKSSIRGLGALFLAMVVFFVWLTYAFFDKKFVDFEPVTVRASNAGLSLPENADVKLRGIFVGEVREISSTDDGVEILLAMKPELLDDVPEGVTVQIVPKTLFGQKYVDLIPPETLTGESLQAGAVIDRAAVPIEVEEVLNNIQPLLTAVNPEDLSYTLTALSDALSGRGEQLGDTLVTTNSYLKKANPDVPQLIDDLVKLGTVADGYSDALPELGRTLSNVTFTGNTLVAKRAQLAAFFDQGTALSNTLTDFTSANAENIPRLASDGRVTLDVLADYAPTFPCFLASMREIIPRLDSAFRDGRLHIDAQVLAPQPLPYASDGSENLEATQQDFDDASRGPAPSPGNGVPITADNAATPSCLDLNEIVGNPEAERELSSQENPFSIPPAVYEIFNVQSDHGKFGDVQPSNRPAASSNALVSTVQPSMGGLDTPAEREALNTLFGARVGMDAADVPDVASLMMSPVLHGTAVSVR